MRKTHWRRLGVAALLSAVVLSGCARGGGDDGPGTSETTSGQADLFTEGLVGPQSDGGEPQSGGSLTWSGYTEPRTLDPAGTVPAGSSGGIEMVQVFDSLLRYDTESGELVPQLAESVTPNDDFTEFTITLRPNVEFSDGTPLDAEAVKWSMDRYASSPRAPEGGLWNQNVTSVEAIDDVTVTITLAERYPAFQNLLATGPGMIVAKASVAGGEESFEAIGAGPFTVRSVAPGEATVLEANPNYWDGKPYLDTLRFTYLGNPQASIDAMNNGDAQAIYLRDPDKVDEMLTGGKSAYVNIQGAANTAILNGNSEAGKDPRVRKAFAMAIDPKVIHERAFGGKGNPTLRLFPEYSRWYNESAPEMEYNPEEAKKLLEEAKADGFSGKVRFTDAQDEASRATALAVQAQLEQVGFEVEPDLVRTTADQISRVGAGDYEIMAWGVGIREFDPYAKIAAAMHSEGTQVYGMPTSPEMDELIDQLKAAEPDQAKEVLGKIEAQFVETVPFVSWAPYAEATVWGDNVHGIQGSANSMVLFHKAWVN